MKRYAAYTTTVVGSHGVPRWFEFLEGLVEAGRLSPPEIADAQYRATQGALSDQQSAGIDVVTGGEMHRRRNNRHAPLNTMANHFWQRMPGFARESAPPYRLVTRERPVTERDPHVVHPAGICVGPIADDADLGLVDEFEMVSRHADRPVKITMTSPYTLARLAWNEHYDCLSAMMFDIAKLLNRNLKRLADAGCRHIQLDEPLLCPADDAEVAAAVQAINLAFEDVSKAVHRSLHVCQGNYAVGVDYDGQLGIRYFDAGRYPAELIAGAECDALLVEGDMADRYRNLLGDRQLGVGVVDVQNVYAETAETIAERVRAIDWLSPEQTILTPSCGMNHLPRHICFAKLQAMTEAKRLLSGA